MSKFLASPIASHLLRIAADPATHSVVRRMGHHGLELGRAIKDIVGVARSPK